MPVLLLLLLLLLTGWWCPAGGASQNGGRVEPARQAEQARQALAVRGEWDELRWSDPSRGKAFRVGIVQAGSGGLEVRRGGVTRVLPWEQIGGVRFGLTMGERQLLAEARPESIPALRVFWEARRLTIKVAGSNAGEFGLALAKALRQTKALEEALRIAGQIEAEDHDERRRGRARAETEIIAFVRAMETLPPEKLEKRAWSVTETAPEENPELMLLATWQLAQREFSALRQLEAEHPRWMEDDEVKPERDRHYHRALDLSLYASLFHPRHREESAQGIWQAARVYGYTGEAAREAGALQDLLALYPDWAPAAARERLSVLQAALEKDQPKREGEEPDKKAEAAEQAPPPPPKRYNLFED